MRSGEAARGHRAPGLFPGIYRLISVFKHIANLPAPTFPKVLERKYLARMKDDYIA